MADEIYDTDILIDHLRGFHASTEYIREKTHAGIRMHVSVVSVAELIAGLRAENEPQIERLLGLFVKHDVTEEIARAAGRYLNQFSKTHHLELADAAIAATAKVLSATLVTRNVKHYPMNDITVSVPYGAASPA
jgi:predicted nucleic acid-binding protein